MCVGGGQFSLGALEEAQGRSPVKKQRHHFADQGPTVVRRRLLRAPWTARRSNLSILKEINPEYPLEGLMLKLKLQYFGS